MEIDTRTSPPEPSGYISVTRPIHTLDLEALIDGELSPENRDRILEGLKDDPALRRKYDELSQQKALLNRWWKSSQ